MNKNLLTSRENDILNLIITGKTNREISDELVITIHTVKAHIASILRKIGGRNRIDIILWFINKRVTKIQ